MADAITLVKEAYRKNNLDQTQITSFSSTLEFPYNLAQDILNDVLRMMNRAGNLWFTETKTALTYGVGTYTYSFTTLAVDPQKVINVRLEATDHWGELTQYARRAFQNRWRKSSILTTKPTAWTKYGSTLELNCIPDQDYTMYVYHYKDMPLVTATSDTTLVPEADEDVLINNCYTWLGKFIGRISEGDAIALIKANTAPFLVSTRNDAGMPNQMPAAF